MNSLEKLTQKIDKYKTKTKDIKVENQAIMVVAELFSGILVGIVIGYFLDRYFATKPFLMAMCFCLGVVGAFMNIYRNMFNRK